MPKLWNETIDAHRNAVREAIMSTTAELVAEHGPASVKMSQIAEKAGIGRATLYKYFPDVDSILVAWHERHVANHLAQLAAIADQDGTPGERLEAVLAAYALIAFHRRRHDAGVAALVHRGEPVATAQQRLLGLFGGLLGEAAATGDARGDITADELAAFCFHALTAAGELPDEDAVHRLVHVTLAGLRPQAETVGPASGKHADHQRGRAHHGPGRHPTH